MARLEELKKFALEEVARLIAETSCGLKLTVRTRCKALYIYHQFNNLIGEMKYDPHLVAGACVNLSAKSYGEKIELDAILMTILSGLKQGDRKSVFTDDFKEMKQSLIKVEWLILRNIDFCLNYHLAHEYTLYFLFDLNQELRTAKILDILYETCMRIISDFYLTSKCLQYKAEDIASSAIHAAFYLSAGVDIDNYPNMKIWMKNMKESEKKLDIFENIYAVCQIGPIATEAFK